MQDEECLKHQRSGIKSGTVALGDISCESKAPSRVWVEQQQLQNSCMYTDIQILGILLSPFSIFVTVAQDCLNLFSLEIKRLSFPDRDTHSCSFCQKIVIDVNSLKHAGNISFIIPQLLCLYWFPWATSTIFSTQQAPGNSNQVREEDQPQTWGGTVAVRTLLL